MENEHNVILCEILPVPRTLPGTTMILLSLDKSLIFFILTIFSRIYFSYKIQGFSNSGEEYIEIDSENNVLTRRVTKFPKLNKPKFLIALTIFSVLFAAVLIPWLFLNSDELDPLYKSGKVLWIKSGEPTYDLKINYDGPDVDTGKLTNWEIDSNDKGSYLGFIKLQIINETANTITLNIDSNAAELLASNGKTYFPTNSVSSCLLYTSPSPRDS